MTANTNTTAGARAAKTAGLLVITMAFVVATAPLAWADGPNVMKATETISKAEGEPADERGNDCDGDGYNDYTLELSGRVIIKVWPDGRIVVHENWDGLAWQEGGSSARIHHALTIKIGADGSFKITGLPFGMFGDPGGPIVKDAGIVRIDDSGFFVAGPHELLENFGLDPNAATCHALGL